MVAIVSEKNNSELKCTLAACVEPVEFDKQFDKLPLHITILPPVIVPEAKFLDLVSGYYNLISSWSSLNYEDDEPMLALASQESVVFGTEDNPVSARRVNLDCVRATEDLLVLRQWLRVSTEDICGKDSTQDWMLGELHISEGNNELSVLEDQLSIDSLVLFIKNNSKWVAKEEFVWND